MVDCFMESMATMMISFSPRCLLKDYLRTLEFKRWLTAVDPSGGCLEYLPKAETKTSWGQGFLG